VIYQQLGTKFDGYYPESLVGEVGYKLVKENIGRVFEQSEGAVVFKGEKFGLHTRVFINKSNLPTYEAKELGLAPTKYADFPYNESLIIVGKEIKEYFKVLVEAMTQIKPELGMVTKPICTGMVNLPEGKMSSRFGNVVTVEGLLSEAGNYAKQLIGESASSFSEAEKEYIASKVGMAAVKYAFLRTGIGKDISFSFKNSVTFDGDSGPYLQYTFARTQSVLVKAKKIEANYTGYDYQMNAEELRVAKYLHQYEEVVEDAALRYSPNLLCSYLNELAQRYNTFYNQHSILSADNENIIKFRLLLTAATGQVIKNGLILLGIEPLAKM
jgi:arginyl-tRNA synthetase